MIAAGICYQAGGKFLLLKRALHSIYGGTWCFPGGMIDQGESPLQAANREFKEETGGFSGFNLPNDSIPVWNDSHFSLFSASGEEFTPVLNDEHTDYAWVDPKNLPVPLHPNVADQIARHAMDTADIVTSREVDANGYVTINRNPITRAGVFPYSGKQLPGADPGRIYHVYRPLEELTKPETLKSFQLLPIIDEHEMLGDGYQRGAEEKGTHGSTGENVEIEGNDILVAVRVFSRVLRNLIESGKRGISLGYRCLFEKSSGVFNGMPYDYIQRNICGNHIALVNEGRSGTAVLDHHFAFDHFDLALDTGELDNMAEENKDAEGEGKKEMSMTDITAALAALMPFMEKVNAFMEAAGSKKEEEVVALDGDTKEKDGDQKAEDEDDDKKKEDKKEKKEDAMDAAEITSLRSRLEALENKGSKAVFMDAAAREKIVKEVTPLVGTFDHAEMSADEVAVYACQKLGLSAVKGQERAALDGYMVGYKKSNTGVAYAMDSVIKPKTGGKLASRLQESA